MGYTHEDLQRAGQCGRSVMYATLRLCGVFSKKDGEYTEEDLARFTLARQMKRERRSDREIADYFKVNLKSAEQEDEEAAEYAAAEAEEAVDIVDVQVAETMVGMYRGSARKFVTSAPALAMRCIVEELNSEASRQKFSELRSQLESSGGSPTTFLLQMAQNRQLAASNPNSISLPAALTESFETEQHDSSDS